MNHLLNTPTWSPAWIAALTLASYAHTPAFATANASLEDELFGGETAAPAQSSDTSNAPAAAPTTSALGSTPLVIGGRLEISSAFNKRQNQSASNADLVRSGTAELYLDSRPAEGLRGFVKGAITHSSASIPTQNSAPPSNVDLALYEMWVKWGGTSSVYTTVGKQKLKWGAASFWNPTDFLAVETKDPLATFDLRPGADLVKFHLPIEAQGHNLYAVIDLENARRAHAPRVAARAELNYGFGDFTGELTTTVAVAKDKPTQLGIDLNTALGPVDFIAETAFTYKNKSRFYQRETVNSGGTQITQKDRSKEVITQIVGGLRYDLKYSESDSANISLEYFWNDAGYADVALEAYSFIQGDSKRLYLANRYLAGSLFLAQPGAFNDSNVIVSALHNLTDKSWLAQAVVSHKIMTRSTWELGVVKTGGAGEMTGSIPASVAERVKSSGVLSGSASTILDSVTGTGQDWAVRISAGIDL